MFCHILHSGHYYYICVKIQILEYMIGLGYYRMHSISSTYFHERRILLFVPFACIQHQTVAGFGILNFFERVIVFYHGCSVTFGSLSFKKENLNCYMFCEIEVFVCFLAHQRLQVVYSNILMGYLIFLQLLCGALILLFFKYQIKNIKDKLQHHSK